MERVSSLILFILVSSILPASSQTSYQLSNYTLEESGAGNQNWDITFDDKGKVLVANNSGLLLLENTDINLFELPDKTIFRSVAYLNDRIYTGSFEDFGFWETNTQGDPEYTSLTPLLDNAELNNDEIWKIVGHEDKIYFHSFGSIYTYDGANVYRLDTQGSYMFLYKVGNRVLTQKVGDGLFELTNDQFIPIKESSFLNDEEVKAITQLSDSVILIGTTKGVYTYDGNNFKNWTGEQVSEVVKNNINAIVQTNDKIIIGTILDGIYIYDKNYKLLSVINTGTQLQNNSILSLAVDSFENVWVGMDKGLSYIAFDTPLHTYRDPTHDMGSVYAATLYNNELYIGTNQGIFWYKRDANGNFYDESLIPDSQGQVWFLKEFDGLLYAGLNDGTYVLRNKSLEKVSSVFGGYTLKPYPNNNANVLLQSTYSDLVVYERDETVWKESYKLEGFATPARFLEFDYTGNIWIGHTVKGIYQLQPNMQFTTIEQSRKMSPEEGLSQSSNQVFKLDNRIMTSFGDSLYQWDAIDEKFVPYNDLDNFFTLKGSVKNISSVGDQKYWVIKNSEIALFEIHFDTIRLLYRLIPDMYNYEMVEGYENVIPLNEKLHVICLDDGFAILNLELAQSSKYPEPKVAIQSLQTLNDSFQEFENVELNNGNPELPFLKNSVILSWSTSQVVGNQTFFQYRLDGLQADWSTWNTTTQAIFERLVPGDYTFLVRSIGTDGMLTETASITFSIKPPWYFSYGAYIFYILVLLSFGLMIRLYISRKRWRELSHDLEGKHKKMLRDKERAEQEITKLNNEKLQSEVEHKSAQLASNTMAIMRKNNLLASIKDELKEQKKKLGDTLPRSYFDKINKMIEDGIEDEHEWEVFEQLYDQAHGDFFKRLKEKYPQLTPSDLRLCAYLRMNLASKEIAPLLNISVRGVEERRYRLRKRMDLSTDTNLTELIMTF